MTAETRIDDGSTQVVLLPEHKWEEGLLEAIRDKGRMFHASGERPKLILRVENQKRPKITHE